LMGSLIPTRRRRLFPRPPPFPGRAPVAASTRRRRARRGARLRPRHQRPRWLGV